MGNLPPAEVDLLTSDQVSKLTGWSRTSINRWAQSGDLPPEHKLPGRTGSYLFTRAVVEQFVQERKPEAAA